MQSITKLGTRTAMAVAVGAAALISAPSSASATEAQPQFWNYRCNDDRACVYHVDGQVWNIEGCGVSGLDDYYNYAKAHGNSFRIYLEDRQTTYPMTYSVDVPAWSEKALDSRDRAFRVQVFC
ncbi:hypothetical protein SAMN05421504_101392 [Amycolatopsis xylanica]|uniref:Peptidase inhibitor family I36 n=1 Tax=Amycolatopsis xylanica TaxID=589385 RepID=A0A1H2SY95_9PSEU|nr:hypothetical protein [Amycolatopsis xylanica]SDW36540.1 hypothetical protein SAMN05421504_101392 [Amycolatopsis xylanica]